MAQRTKPDAWAGDVIEYSGELGVQIAEVQSVCFGNEGVSYDVRIVTFEDDSPRQQARVAASDTIHRVWRSA